jgi:hypothetical protein
MAYGTYGMLFPKGIIDYYKYLDLWEGTLDSPLEEDISFVLSFVCCF